MTTNKQHLLKNSKHLSIYMFLLAFLFILIAANLGRLNDFNYTIIETIQSGITPSMTAFMKFITYLGSFNWIIIVLVGSTFTLLFKKKYSLAVYLIFTYLFGRMFIYLLKVYFHVERPHLNQLIEQGGYSFPSGHSMNSVIFYVSLAFVVSKINKMSILDWVLGAFCFCLILLVGISRIYLGVHYPTDVLGGYMAGGFWVCICTLLLNFYELRRK